MNIDLNNYEEFFVRFIDDDLSKEERTEVHLFLQHHPELKSELDAFSSTILSADESLKFDGKELLKKGITADNCDEYFLRWVENDLTEEEKNGVTTFLQEHPQFEHVAELYKKTILIPDIKIQYPNKNALKKKAGRVVPLYSRYILAAAIAASLFLIIYTRGIEWNRSGIDSPSIAKTSNTGEESIHDKTAKNINSPGVTDSEIDQESKLPNLKADKDLASVNSTNNPVNGKTENGRKKIRNSLKEDFDLAAVSSTPMKPLMVRQLKSIPYNQPLSKAPYLVAVYDDEVSNASNQNSNAFSGGSWLSFASVVGAELLRLSGRGDLIKNSSDTLDQLKSKEAVAVSIHTDKFAFYHTFSHKKKTGNAKKK